MTQLRQRMIEDMQLRGYSARTQEAYARAVRQLAEYFHRSPDQVSEEELRRYFLYLANEKKFARTTTTIALCGIKFFYEQTLHRDWPTLRFVRPAYEFKLPVVLSREEVQLVLSHVRVPVYRMCLTTIYSCGLRLMEGALYCPSKPQLLALRPAAGTHAGFAARVLEDAPVERMVVSRAAPPWHLQDRGPKSRPGHPHQLTERLLPGMEENRHCQTRARAHAEA